MAALRLGRFDIGWRAYEQRWRIPRLGPQNSLYASNGLIARMTLDFDLSDLTGKSVLLIDEQGVGDHIMFASMLPDLAAVALLVTGLLAEVEPLDLLPPVRELLDDFIRQAG